MDYKNKDKIIKNIFVKLKENNNKRTKNYKPIKQKHNCYVSKKLNNKKIIEINQTFRNSSKLQNILKNQLLKLIQDCQDSELIIAKLLKVKMKIIKCDSLNNYVFV
jgi:hypothetical protein